MYSSLYASCEDEIGVFVLLYIYGELISSLLLNQEYYLIVGEPD